MIVQIDCKPFIDTFYLKGIESGFYDIDKSKSLILR